MCYNLLWKLLLCNVTSALTRCDSFGFGATKWTILTHTWLKICWTGVVIMPAAVVYLCIALFTELFNLAGGDIPVLITVSTLVERQASADSTFPRSWIIKTHHFILSHAPHRSVVLRVWRQEKNKKGFLHPETPHSSQSPLISENMSHFTRWEKKNYYLQLTVFKKVCDV